MQGPYLLWKLYVYNRHYELSLTEQISNKLCRGISFLLLYNDIITNLVD